ncbi:hypothetical protein BpOF4_20784 (plasmid) [Alkalihalophilus pseudofirmus OF4]|uniref:Uncharacterized protein n=1 Tax=Alkalihalophilus pseudofirmus (strain ATCC BAA-2126 / JCM 17055 / OF4) TaxID=398511 RepID=D3G1C6_ALKPO|nr:hypothetical protein [Alkalihalophilus pseudofirmus]ADC52152.1 hypothetical protein BpOF4_20784 [Alkalihalophilus pseudofirmus OF4]
MRTIRFKDIADFMERTTGEAAVSLSMPPINNEVGAYRIRCFIELLLTRMEKRKVNTNNVWMEIKEIKKVDQTFLVTILFDRLKSPLVLKVPENITYGSISYITKNLRELDSQLEGILMDWFIETKQGWIEGNIMDLSAFQMNNKAV